MGNLTAYIILIIAVVLGTASNSFAKSADGFTLLIPSIITAITIVACMYTLSIVMKSIPVGITYASFAGLCIIATSIVGVIKFQQIPNFYTLVGLLLIISGVLIVNFYESPDKCEVNQSFSLEEGDLILLSGGIHGFEIGEDCRFLEIKQGPFKASGDKIKLYD